MREKQHILMIKKCLTTGMMYLCKTSSWKRDPYVYQGSGIFWKRHIAHHSSYVITCVVGEYDTKQELAEAGLQLSRELSVVTSPQWANLTEEKGDGGLIGAGQLGKTWKMSVQAVQNVVDSRQKMKEDGRMAKRSLKRLGVCSGRDNYQFKGIIVTPWGEFLTIKDAALKARELKGEGRKDVVCDDTTLRKYLKHPDVALHAEGRRTFPQWRGKTPVEIGFYIKKEQQ